MAPTIKQKYIERILPNKLLEIQNSDECTAFLIVDLLHRPEFEINYISALMSFPRQTPIILHGHKGVGKHHLVRDICNCDVNYNYVELPNLEENVL